MDKDPMTEQTQNGQLPIADAVTVPAAPLATTKPELPAVVAPAEKPDELMPVSRGIASPYSGGVAFNDGWRMAKSLAASSIVPDVYRGKPENCLIALELAANIQISVLSAMQNLHIIKGKPSWSAPFLIACVNTCGRFTPLRYEWAGEPGKPSWSCRAIARSRLFGDVLEGTWITWEMATKEGWTSKSGSKWLTMPQQMFQYRAASFWTRAYAPEISMGFQTSEEVFDTTGYVVPEPTDLPGSESGAKALAAVLGLQKSATATKQED